MATIQDVDNWTIPHKLHASGHNVTIITAKTRKELADSMLVQRSIFDTTLTQQAASTSSLFLPVPYYCYSTKTPNEASLGLANPAN